VSNPPDQVVITDFIDDDLQIERDVLGDIATVKALNASSEAELGGSIEDAAAVMMYHNIGLSATSIRGLTRCKVIVRCGVGFDNVDYITARQCGIPVANVPDYGTEEVADTAIGMMLALTRGIQQYNVRLQSRDDPWMYTIAKPLYRLRGRVFGIVGLGRIGIAAAMRAKAIGMDVRFYDPYRDDGFDKAIGVTRVESLEQLMKESHVLSVHCPLNPETHHMINGESLTWMKPGSYLVNTARGAVVDVTALPNAIAEGRLAGAAIDVLTDEPPAEDNPLVVAWRDTHHPAHERLIINPHAAFYSEEGLSDMRRKGAEACRRALLDQPLRNVIN
jgi:D-3-phosphoglycerate dehydrogenase/C-terminal binding protein